MALKRYRNTSDTARYDYRAKQMGNSFPSYMKMRYDKYSNYQQLINSISKQHEDMDEKLRKHNRNMFPQTFDVNSIDVLYTTDYVKNRTYQYVDSPYTLNTVLSKYNTVYDWYYKELPTGLRKGTDNTPYPDTILNAVPLQKEIIVDQYYYPNISVYVSLSGANKEFIKNNFGEDILPMQIIIHGLNEQSVYVSEEFNFYISNTFRSETKWKKIDKIESVYYDSLAGFNLSVSTSPPRLESKERHISFVDDEKNIKEITHSWDSANNLLEQKVISADNIQAYYAGVFGESTIFSYGLYSYDSSGSLAGLTSVDSILSDEYSNIIYVASGGFLIGYDKRENISQLYKKLSIIRTQDPQVYVDADIQTGTVVFSGHYKSIKLSRKIDKYRFVLTFEDGTELICQNPDINNQVNNTWVPFSPSMWTDYNIKETYGFLSPKIQYDNSGNPFDQDFIIRIDVLNTNGVIETDAIIVDRQYKYPLFQQPLPGVYTSLYNLTQTHNGNLAIVGNNHMYEIKLRNDTYIIANDKVIFAENYNDDVNKIVAFDGTISAGIINLTPQNVINSLDSYGAMHSLKRHDGETSDDFLDRLKFSFHNPFNSSKTGLINYISVSTGLFVKDYMTLSSSSEFIVDIKYPVIKITVDNILYSKYIYEFNTIGDLSSWINSIYNISSTVVLSEYSSLPPNAVMDFTNTNTYNSTFYDGDTIIELPLSFDERVINNSISIDGIDRDNYSVLNNAVTLKNPIDYSNRISYKTYYKNCIVKASPVILSSINSSPAMFLESIPAAVSDSIKHAELILPHKWNI